MNSEIDVLIAEDEEHIAKLVSFKLGREGFRITVARNGQEAIDQLEAKSWKLFILDVMMPIHDGWTVLKSIRSHPVVHEVPILMLTAKSFQKDLANAADLGATRFLKKPFDPTELALTARKMIEGEGSR